MKKFYFLLFVVSLLTSTGYSQLSPLACGTGTATLLYTQDFESGFPSDWSHSSTIFPQWQYNVGQTSSSGTGPSAAFSNTGYIYLETSGGSLGDTDTLFVPSTNLTSTVDAARATWAYHMYGIDMGSLAFQVSTDGAIWTELWSINGQVQTSNAAAWIEVEVDLTSYAGSIVQMRFIGTRGNNFTSDMAIDLFQVEACISCPQPTALLFSNVTTTTVDLDWTAGGTETAWIIEYGPIGYTPGTGTQFPTSNNPETLSGLIDNTAFDIYVFANCGSGDISIPVGPVSIMTGIVCPPPSAFSFTYANNDTVAVTWTPGGLESAWNVEYGLTGYTPGTGTQHAATIVPDTTFGVPAGGIYDFYIQANCGGGLNNPWTGPITYIAPITNDEPCGAITVPVNGSTAVYANVGATVAVGEPTVGFNTAWFKFTAPASGHVEIKTCGNTFNNMLAIYSTPICSNLSLFTYVNGATGNPFTGCTGTFDPAGLNMCGLVPGNLYYLVIGGETVTDEGTFPLTLTEIPLITAGTSDPQDICEDNASYNLFDAITGNDSENGTWYNPTVAPGNVFPSTLSFVGTPPGSYPFIYVDMSVCQTVQVQTTITVHPIPNVGTGGIINNVCNFSIVNLYEGLNGTIDIGGVWHDINGVDVPGGFIDFSGESPGIYKYYYVIDNGGCPADSTPVNVQLIDCAGIEESGLVAEIYPNPVNDVVNINFSQIDGNTTLRLVNVNGQEIVLPIQVSNMKSSIDMSELAAGVYFLIVSNDKTSQTIRVMKE